METKSEDQIHKLRLKISETMLDNNNNNSNARATNSPKNFNSNSDFSLADKLNDDFENLSINTPRTDANANEDDDEERGIGVGDEFEDSGGGINGDEEGYQRARHKENDENYPYTSESSHQKHNKNDNSTTAANQTVNSKKKSWEKISESTDNTRKGSQVNNQQQPLSKQQQLANSGTKYKNNILNYYFNDKSVKDKNLNNLTPRHQNQQPLATYRVPQQQQFNSNNYTSIDAKNTHRLNGQNDQQYPNNFSHTYRAIMDDLNNPQNNGVRPLLTDVDLDSDPQTEMFLEMSVNNIRRSRLSNMQSPSVLARKPPNTLPPLSTLGLADMGANQYSSGLLRSPKLTSNPHVNPQLMYGINSYRSQLPIGPGSELNYNIAAHDRSRFFPFLLPTDSLGRTEPFDALQTRRRLLNEMSQTNLRMPSSLERPNGIQTMGSIRPPGQYPLNTVIETRLAPVSSGNNLIGAALNETIVSNDVEDLIDVMAKRRLAIKKLENEMYRQHSRASNIIRPPYEDPLVKTSSQMNMRLGDPYSFNGRSSRVAMNGQQAPLGFENSILVSRTNNNGNSLADFRPNGINLITNLDYPSESNREIYSTYLVDSIRPHYSAKRLVNGVRPMQPAAPGLGVSQVSRQLSSNMINGMRMNQMMNQPINFDAELELLNDPDNVLLGDPFDNNLRTNFFTPITNKKNRPPSFQNGLNGGAGLQQNPNNIKNDIDDFIDRSYSNISNSQPKKYTSKFAANDQKLKISNQVESPIMSPRIHENSKNSLKAFKNRSQQAQKSPTPKNENDDSDEDSKPNKQINRELMNESELKMKYNRQGNDSQTHKKQSVVLNKTIDISKSPSISRSRNYLATRFPRLHAKNRLIWGPALLIRFFIRIKNKAKQSAQKNINRSGSAALFRIRLLEIMTALHRVYLEPEGPIYTSLMEFIKNPNDMTVLFDQDSPIYESCVNVMCQNLEEIITHITEFMPKEGIVGTTTKSALLSLISEGNRFPENYFWDVERERLRFDEHEKIRNITRGRAILLLLSAMISRALITTLLIKPVKFRLLRGDLPQNQRNNLKILATLMCYLVRWVNDTSNQKMGFPWEWQSSLFNDTKMVDIYNNPQIKLTLDRCQRSLATWAGEYVTRLDETSGLKR